jgi:hypothetical protein
MTCKLVESAAFWTYPYPHSAPARARWEDAESDDGLFYPSVGATVTVVT